eukprot:TRINITY_DN1921_c0_g1_i1.p1 TRINITY_DN1921_c0_g1~~TRINITY_DN1921_c0_g1_i1.p1  ORF type:complete len:263 (+),score=56.27 TRINITY_DN1921_c0_g1_i1:60-791(+)
MGIHGGAKCSQVFLVLINILFIILGVALIAGGIFLLVRSFGTPSGLAFIALAIGIVALILSIIGCVGTIKGSSCALVCYFIFVLILSLIVLGAAIAGMIFRNQAQSLASEVWTLFYNSPAAVAAQLPDLEASLNCCGFNTTTNMVSPPSVQPPYQCSAPQIANGPCEPILVSAINMSLLWVSVGFFAMAGLQIIGMLMSCVVRSAYNDRRRDDPENRARADDLKRLFDAPASQQSASVYNRVR